MALYLNDQTADFGLIGIPTHSHFEFQSLLQFSTSLNGKKRVSWNDFEVLARQSFGFTCDQSNLYFHAFSTFANQNIADETVATVGLVLFLYNQLFLAPGHVSAALKADADFPTYKEEAHDPLGLFALPPPSSRASTASLDDTDDDQQTFRSFPGILLEKRHQLASFWRSSAKKWLALVFLTLYGTDGEGSNETIMLSHLADLELFFTPVAPTDCSEEYAGLKARFHHWRWTREEPLSYESAKPSHRRNETPLVYKANLSDLLLHIFKDDLVMTDLNEPSISRENLLLYFQWSIMERPAHYEVLELTSHGVHVSSEIIKSHIFSEIEKPQVLLSRRQGLMAAIHPSQILGQRVVLHRLQNCEIYLTGPIDSLIVSKCRNCTVFAGVVKGTVAVRSSSKVTLTSCCRGLLFSDEEHNLLKGTGGNVAYVSTLTRPVVECTLQDNTVTFAPCNAWYKGMVADLSAVGHDLSKNMWDQALQIQLSNTADACDNAAARLAPPQFFLNEIPFDFAVSDSRAAAAAEPTADQNPGIEFTALYQALPPNFSNWIKSTAGFSTRLQEIMAKAAKLDANFHGNVTSHFEAWLRSDNGLKLNALEALQKMRLDLE
ncbi:TBCC domain-containing protein 1, partial [Kappamyces sp. JEL0680]